MIASLRLGEPHLAGASGAAVLLSGLPLTVVPLRWPHSTGEREERPMSAKFVMFTNAATKEPILVNPDHVCSAQPVPGHHRVKLLVGGERDEYVEGDLKSVWEKLEEKRIVSEPKRSPFTGRP
jgi:hypothetical protein